MGLMADITADKKHKLKLYAQTFSGHGEVFLFCTECGVHLDPEREPTVMCHSEGAEHSFKILIKSQGVFSKPIIVCGCKGNNLHIPNGEIIRE